jgi:hypothetical protein
MAVKSDFSIRVAVGSQHGRRSPIWNIFSTRDEVYALHRTMGRIEKISFHKSRICRRAFVDKHLPPIERWTRAETPSAGQMKVRIVQVLFSYDTQAYVLGQQLVFHHRLPNGEGVVIRSWTNSWEQADVIVPASHGTTGDIIFPATYQPGTARPVMLTMYAHPDELRCFELTGFRVPAGEARRRFPQADTLSRNEVLRRGTGS